MQVAAIVVEGIKALTTWPVAMFALGFFFLRRFRDEIGLLLRSVETLTWGDKKVDVARQADKNRTEPAQSTPPPPIAPTPVLVSDQTAPDDASLRSAKELAALWEYRYLHGFLVPRTQLVLDWLASREPTLYSTYDAWWMESVPEAYERNAVISALQAHHLIDVEATRDHLMKVTDKGREYLAFRGPLEAFLKVKWPSRPPSPLPSPRRAPSSPPPPFASLADLGEVAEPSSPPRPPAPAYVAPRPAKEPKTPPSDGDLPVKGS